MRSLKGEKCRILDGKNVRMLKRRKMPSMHQSVTTDVHSAEDSAAVDLSMFMKCLWKMPPTSSASLRTLASFTL